MDDFGTFGLVSSFKRRGKPRKFRYTFLLLVAAFVALIAAALYFLLS